MDGTAVNAIERLANEAAGFVQIGEKYFRKSNMTPIKMDLPEDVCDALKANSLTAIVNYAIEHLKKDDAYKLFINVEEYNKINLYSELNRDAARNLYVSSEFKNDRFPYGQFIPSEDFTIKVQAQFEETPDKAKVLQYAGNVGEELSKKYKDDGITQSAEVKTGVVSKEEMVVPNPVVLAPYRTFTEISQPNSSFIFRAQQSKMGKGIDFALFEADGGNWRITATESIRAYFNEKLSEGISSGKVIIL